MSIYKGMLESSVITINDDGEPVIPYYSKDRIETYIDTYLKENISKYTTKFTINTRYFDENSDVICNEYCRSVSINLKANINVFYEYDKTQTFVVKSGQAL